MYPDNKRLSAWLLSVLILFGQTAALIHQSEHDVLESHNYCTQCLTQSVFDGKLVVPVHTYSILPADTASLDAAESPFHSYHTATLRTRSPPISPA